MKDVISSFMKYISSHRRHVLLVQLAFSKKTYYNPLMKFFLGVLNLLVHAVRKTDMRRGMKVVMFASLFCSVTIGEHDKPNDKEFACFQRKGQVFSKNVSNLMNLKKYLVSAGFDSNEVKKITTHLTDVIGSAWYDQSAKIEIAFTCNEDRKVVTKAVFYGVGKCVKLSYENSLATKSETSKTKQNLVVMKGFINSTLEKLILNNTEIPCTLRNNVLNFARNARMQTERGDKFYCLYDPHDFTVLGMSVTRDAKKSTAIAFNSSKGKKLFTSDGTAINSEKLVFLRPVHGRISGVWGYRKHPVLHIYRFHYGLDIAAPSGTPIQSAADGVIIYMGRLGGYGNCVKVQHGNIITLYAHLQRFTKNLCIGSRVRAGQKIGYVGMTGLASGPHLHYEIAVGGKKVNPQTFSAHRNQKLEGQELQSFKAYAGRITQYFA